jgi:transcriptional regulator with XRE-family HTH domain
MKRQAANLVSLSNIDRSRRSGLVDTKPDPTSSAEIGARLVLTRKALGYTQARMARLIGVDGQTLVLYEAGRRRIPANQALKLAAYGIPLEWIYEGRMANLHPHVRAKIRELTKREERGGH